ncbi:hypothetical protein ACFY2M_40425 [Streptomyces sp. NPDC001276]
MSEDLAPALSGVDLARWSCRSLGLQRRPGRPTGKEAVPPPGA